MDADTIERMKLSYPELFGNLQAETPNYSSLQQPIIPQQAPQPMYQPMQKIDLLIMWMISKRQEELLDISRKWFSKKLKVPIEKEIADLKSIILRR